MRVTFALECSCDLTKGKLSYPMACYFRFAQALVTTAPKGAQLIYLSASVIRCAHYLMLQMWSALRASLLHLTLKC